MSHEEQANWRNERNVLVPQADALGMLGVIRSLGRAGYRVHACSSNPSAIGLFSHFAAQAIIHPHYDQPEFLTWLDDYIETRDIDVIVPSEGFLVAVQHHFERYASMLPDNPGRAGIYRCLSKAAVFDVLLACEPDGGAGAYLPPTVVIKRGSFTSDLARIPDLDAPFFVKADACQGQAGASGEIVRCETLEDVRGESRRLIERYEMVLVQSSVPGCKATVNVMISGGDVLGETMCLAMHENPHTGGLTTYRKTWWQQAMRDDAERKLRALGWQGVAMVEYKWNAETQSFHFIELNSRYWAALHLDLFAGSDFPRLQIDRYFGRLAKALARQPLDRKCRYAIPADFGYALSRIRDAGVPVYVRLWTAIEFLLLFLRPDVKADLLFPGDRALYWRRWRAFLASLSQAVVRKFGTLFR